MTAQDNTTGNPFAADADADYGFWATNLICNGSDITDQFFGYIPESCKQDELWWDRIDDAVLCAAWDMLKAMNPEGALEIESQAQERCKG